MNGILGHIAGLYEADPVACGGMLAAAARELRMLNNVVPNAEVPSRLPVCQYLGATISAARKGPLAAIAGSFAAYEPHALWRQNPNYSADVIGQEFLHNYGYVELVGRHRPWASDRLAVGLLMLGPGTHYPAHSHPAAEVYHVVSGAAEWGQSDNALTVRPVGAAIYHAPNVVHETRALSEPLLALYCWIGDIGVAAKLA